MITTYIIIITSIFVVGVTVTPAKWWGMNNKREQLTLVAVAILLDVFAWAVTATYLTLQ